MHTCGEANPWWMVDLRSMRPIGHVIIYNRWDDCCRSRLNDSELQVLDANKNIITSKPIINSISTNHIYFDTTVVGRYVRVQKTVSGDLNVS